MASSSSDRIERGRPSDAADLILQRRHRLARRYAPREGGYLLDFGCGNGAQARLFAPHFAGILGVDVSPVQLGRFAGWLRETGDPRLLPIRYDGFRLPVADGAVDQVVSFEVLEHVADEAAALGEIHRVLKPGGSLVISVPHRWWIFETHGANLPLLPWNRVPLFSWLPKGLHDRWARARNYRKGELVGNLRDHGFVVRHASRITAPLDVLPEGALRRSLRRGLFAADETRVPFLATALLAVAEKPL
jgi:SAM-dependent methyltransferase